jgi:hypothetical protein
MRVIVDVPDWCPACSFHKKVGKVTNWLESHSVPDRTRKQVCLGPS